MEKYFQVVEFPTLPADSELRQKVSLECPMDGSSGQLGANNDDKLNDIGTGIGNIFGGISALIPIDKINHQTSQKVTQVSRQSFSEANLSKWQRFKARCSAVNNTLTEKMTPISNKCVEIKNDIGKKFEVSENSFIKNLR